MKGKEVAQTMDRDVARKTIVAMAEKHRQKLPVNIRFHARPHCMKRIQWAVFCVRQNRLVEPEVLKAAGYRP